MHVTFTVSVGSDRAAVYREAVERKQQILVLDAPQTDTLWCELMTLIIYPVVTRAHVAIGQTLKREESWMRIKRQQSHSSIMKHTS